MQAHSPATGKTVDRILQLTGLEPEAENECLRARHSVVRTGVMQRHVGVRHALAVASRFGGGDFGLCSNQRRVAFNDECRRADCCLGHILRHLRNPPARWLGKLPAILVQTAVDQTEER